MSSLWVLHWCWLKRVSVSRHLMLVIQSKYLNHWPTRFTLKGRYQGHLTGRAPSLAEKGGPSHESAFTGGKNVFSGAKGAVLCGKGAVSRQKHSIFHWRYRTCGGMLPVTSLVTDDMLPVTSPNLWRHWCHVIELVWRHVTCDVTEPVAVCYLWHHRTCDSMLPVAVTSPNMWRIQTCGGRLPVTSMVTGNVTVSGNVKVTWTYGGMLPVFSAGWLCPWGSGFLARRPAVCHEERCPVGRYRRRALERWRSRMSI